MLENGYVELSESFTSQDEEMYDLDKIEFDLKNENIHIEKIRSSVNEYSTNLYKECFKLMCQKDIENIIVIIPESKITEYNFLEKEDWVFFDKYTNDIVCIDRDFINKK